MNKYQKTIYNLVHLNKARGEVFIDHKQLQQDIDILWELYNKYDELTKTPTLEEVKKEWGELGWFFTGLPEDVKNKVSCITISKYVGKNIFSTTDIQLDLEEKDCFIRGLINYRELQLLTKTFRALGWEV